jgi:CheY-like chemotaxis protein
MLVELHHGSIQASSPGRGQGACFRITLPLLRADSLPPPSSNHPFAAPAESAAGTTRELQAMHGRILLIEDHAPTRATLQQLLLRRHYEVVAAGTVAEARALADREHIDFVISDIGLPDGNAYDLMKDLRAQRGLTGIALTGYGMESDIARSHAAGFVVHLTKPLRVQSLDEALARLAASMRH